MAYMKGYFLMANKAMFDISKLDTDSYAQSLGLVLIPRIRFLQKQEKLESEKKNRLEGSVAFGSLSLLLIW